MRDHRSLRYILPRFWNPWASFVLSDQDASRNRVKIEVRTDTFMEEAKQFSAMISSGVADGLKLTNAAGGFLLATSPYFTFPVTPKMTNPFCTTCGGSGDPAAAKVDFSHHGFIFKMCSEQSCVSFFVINSMAGLALAGQFKLLGQVVLGHEYLCGRFNPIGIEEAQVRKMSCNQRNLNILDKYPPHLHIAEMDEITWSSGMRKTRQQKRKIG